MTAGAPVAVGSTDHRLRDCRARPRMATPMKSFFAALAIASLALAGCQQESAPAHQNDSSAPTVGTAPAGLTITPSTLPNCDGAVVDVRWDAAKAGVSTAGTEVWIGDALDDAKLFAAAGAQGDARTGHWARPGSHFFLKNKADGKLIAQAVVGGPTCH